MPEKVYLYIYELTNGLVANISQSILGFKIDGIWHTGVVVFGKEFFFQGGIQSGPPGQIVPIPIYKKLLIGETYLTESIFQEYLNEIRPRFTQDTYNLIKNNCNHFSSEICLFLTGNPIPSYILDLANIVSKSPNGKVIIDFLEKMMSDVSNRNNFTKNNTTTIKKTHPHEKLKLKSLCKNLCLLTVDNIDEYLALLNSYVSKGMLNINQDDSSSLKSLISNISKVEVTKEKAIALFSLFQKNLFNNNLDFVFPLLSILCYILSKSKELSSAFCTKEFIPRLIEFSKILSEDNFIKNKSLISVHLTVLSVLCNIFACASEKPENSVLYMSEIIEISLQFLKHQMFIFRYIASCLLYNCSIYLPKKCDEKYIQIITAVCDVISRDRHDIIIKRLLSCLLNVIYMNDEVSEVAKAIYIHIDRRELNEECKDIMDDIRMVLKL